MDVATLTIKGAHESLKRGDFSARELAQAHLKKVEEKDKDVHAYIEVFDDVLHQADVADRRLKEEGEDAPSLLGIPLAMKDNILIKGRKATAGSKILEGYEATYDAHVSKKLKEEGAVFLGRTNMDEFAMGSSTESSAYGATKNPRDYTRVPGGSSGGSGAAVAMNGALGALGSDTGGSVRLPGSFCGVVGLKPTYGSVSRCGLIAMGSSLDVIGPFAKTVSDTEIIFDAIKGKDERDGTSLRGGSYQEPELKKKYTIGVPREFLKEGLGEDTLQAFEASLSDLKEKGHTVVDVKLPNVKYALAAYYIIMPAESSTNLERFDGVRFGLFKEGPTLLRDYEETRSAFGPEVKRRILIGSYVLSAGYVDAYYHKARAVKELIRGDFLSAFRDVEAIATPTSTGPAFKIGEKSDPLSMYLADIFTVPANLVGIPGISIPHKEVERDGKSLPVGFQLLAPHMHEKTLFSLGKHLLNEDF